LVRALALMVRLTLAVLAAMDLVALDVGVDACEDDRPDTLQVGDFGVNEFDYVSQWQNESLTHNAHISCYSVSVMVSL